MTEALPVTDVALAEIDAAGGGRGRVRRAPASRRDGARRARCRRSRSADGPLTDAGGVTGEICVRAAHVKDRYDQLWATEHATSRDPGWHRTGDVGHLDDEGRLWIEGRLGHVIATAHRAGDAGRDRAAGGGRRGRRAAAAVGVGPRGTQQVVVVVVSRGPSRPGRAAARSRTAHGRGPRRGGRRRRGGAADATRCRSTSGTLPRSTDAGGGVGRAGARRPADRQAAVKVLVTGATSMLGAAVADRLAARGDTVTVLQRRPSGLPHREVLGDVTDRGAVVNARPRPRRGGAPGREGRHRRAGARSSPAPTSAGPGWSWRRAVAPRCRGSSTSRPRPWRTAAPRWSAAPAGPADPHRARGHYARSKAVAELLRARRRRRARRPRRRRGASAPGVGAGRHPARRSHHRQGPRGQAPGGRLGRRAHRHHLHHNAADALVAALDRCTEARGQAFVVSNGEPRPVAELLAAICRAAGVRSPRRAFPPPWPSWPERSWRRRGRCAPPRDDPPMTRFLAEQLGTAHWFDQRRTTELLAWTPRVSLDAGLAALAASSGQLACG